MITTLWLTYVLPVIDVLLIAFVFYQVLLLIKGTHSVQVVMGLAVLMGMTLVIRHFLKLPAATWLLENFWSGAVVEPPNRDGERDSVLAQAVLNSSVANERDCNLRRVIESFPEIPALVNPGDLPGEGSHG